MHELSIMVNFMIDHSYMIITPDFLQANWKQERKFKLPSQNTARVLHFDQCHLLRTYVRLKISCESSINEEATKSDSQNKHGYFDL